MVNYNPLCKLKISEDMSGKMTGINGLSTSVAENRVCAARRKIPGSICEKCFAASVLERYKNCAINYSYNLSILRQPIPENELPRLTCNIFRLESFGDCESVQQAVNYCRICTANPDTTFSVWTKNFGFYRVAFEKVGKPENLIFGLSSLFVDKRDDIPTEIEKYVDFQFTVYTAEHAYKNGIRINCGGKKCITCRNCYGRNARRQPGQPVRVINEILKSDLKKYERLTGYAYTDENAF